MEELFQTQQAEILTTDIALQMLDVAEADWLCTLRKIHTEVLETAEVAL